MNMGLMESCLSFENYIKPQQHNIAFFNYTSCLSFENYIKPQLYVMALLKIGCCLSFENYIKPQPSDYRRLF